MQHKKKLRLTTDRIVLYILIALTIIALLISIIMVVIINLPKVVKVNSDKNFDRPRLFFNGHPINRSEAQRLGNVTIKELRELYP